MISTNFNYSTFLIALNAFIYITQKHLTILKAGNMLFIFVCSMTSTILEKHAGENPVFALLSIFFSPFLHSIILI